MTGDLLQPQVRRLFANLSHAGDQRGADPHERVVVGEAGRLQHGTRVRFTLRLRDSRVVSARYSAYGCPYTLAVCEWLAGRLESSQTTSLGTPADWCAALGVPIMKLGRLLVVEDALSAALDKCGPGATSVSENVVK